MKRNITYAVKEDMDEIEHIMNQVLGSMEHKEWYVTDDRAFLERHIEKEGYILKYMENETIAGFLVVRHPGVATDNLGREIENCNEELLGKVAHMESAAVLPAYRGQRIQKKLLEAAEEQERKLGMHYLMATVHPDNVYSCANLETLGYRCLKETSKYGGLPRLILYKEL